MDSNSNFLLNTIPRRILPANAKVAELIDEDTKRWNTRYTPLIQEIWIPLFPIMPMQLISTLYIPFPISNM